MKKPTLPQILLVIAALLAPIIGGQINTEATALAPGADSLLRSIFSGFDSIISYFAINYQPGPAIETPTLSHAVIGLIVVAAAILTLARRQVFQIPFLRVSVPLLGFMAWLICTLAFTSFMSVSLVALAEWLIYGIVFFTVVSTAGRRRGTSMILMALVIGCALVAIKGLFEYGTERHIDPTWRVFSTWANPTSLAGMMAIGMMLGLGLAIMDEDITSALPWTCALAMGCCIMVTDARGGILSMLGGIVCLTGFVCFWAPKNQARLGVIKIGSVLLLALLFGRWVHPTAGASHSNVAQIKSPYVLASQTTQATPAPPPAAAATVATEQSSQFRFLLWRGALKLIKENGLGYGMGTYRFESARPGLTTETQLAHNTYLQIGVEAGVLGFVLFLVFLGAWMFEVVRGCYLAIRPISLLRIFGTIVASYLLFAIVGLISHVEVFPSNSQKIIGACGFGLVWLYVEFFRKSPDLMSKQNVLRACIIAAVVAMLFDNVLESGLYSFGIGVSAFIILGLGLIQSADGIAPEFIPKSMRAGAGVIAFLAAITLLHAGAVETLRSRGRYELSNAVASGFGSQDSVEGLKTANEIADKALDLAPLGIDRTDGENWRLKANVEEAPFNAVIDLRKAAEWAPNTRNLRALGLAMLMQQDYQAAILNFNLALEKDPNNLLTLPKLRDAYWAAGQQEKAIETAQRTVNVENTPYFKVRSLPQLIPVETYEARAFLAAQTKDLNQRAVLLEQAVAGYQLYLQSTVPLIMQLAQTDPSAQYGGENVASARYKMTAAAQYAKQLADTYRQLKKPSEEARAYAMQQGFAKVFATPSA